MNTVLHKRKLAVTMPAFHLFSDVFPHKKKKKNGERLSNQTLLLKALNMNNVDVKIRYQSLVEHTQSHRKDNNKSEF